MSPDHVTAGAYNQDIDKRLARKLVWLRETMIDFTSRGPSRIGISYAFLRFWNLALAEKLCIPLNILGFCISKYFNYHEILFGIQNYLESLPRFRISYTILFRDGPLALHPTISIIGVGLG